VDPSPQFSVLGSGFQVLWEDGERALGRTWWPMADGGQRAVLAVRPTAEHPSSASLERLVHEYRLRDQLDSAWAARPLELVREGSQTLLLLEDPGGEPLAGLLTAPLETGRFLRLAISILTALRKVHQRGLVHKDLKPAHILVDANEEVRLTGFGLASRLPRERQAPEPPETIAGTLAYMAPEQTGRMNRSINARSDLYSLGVTLYQMLTGTLPFTAADPMEWVHCHIARTPVPPSERVDNVPAPVSAIVMKLLAKTAEERYQTASGVGRDLRRCLTEWEAHGHIEAFALGQQDTPDRLLIPEKLYGRSHEVETLLAAFNRIVKSGPPELVLISGYSGIGKSSVVNELHKALVLPHGLFAAGKFDQYKRDIPYATLAQAFQSLVRLLLSKSETELAGWRDALLEALAANGRLMVDVVPELKLIIGEQPPVPELPPHDAQRRFQLVFRRFIGVFAQAEHPLALFLDDLQWLDAATLDLIEDLLTRSDLQHLMLIGAYRDNEVTATHALMRTLDAIHAAGGKVAQITLAPLAREHLGQLIADALRCDFERAAPLAQLVHEKAGGNPFFAIQFIASLVEEDMLTFDHDAMRWSWDLGRIHAKGYTDNVVNLMVGKLIRLPAETQAALQQLACIGNTAEITTLTIAFGTSAEQVHAALSEAVLLEFVERLKDSYKFVHDRIQEAAYSLIPEASRAPAHLRIGRLLAAQTPPEQRQEMIFEIVGQLNRGAALITEQEERERLAELNLIAGKRAKASTAYASALNYLSTGMTVLGGAGWTSPYELAFGLWLERAECEYLSGNFEEAEHLLSELLARGASKIDMVAAYRLKIDLHVLKSENPKAVDSALECLHLFDVDMPPHPAREQVEAEYEKVWSAIGGRPIESLIDLPLMTDPEMQSVMRVLSVLNPPAYFTDINLVHLHLCHMVNITLRYGMTDASAHAYAWFGVILGPVFHRYGDGYRFGRLACDLVERHDLVAYKARNFFSMEMVALWTQPPEAAIDSIRMAFRTGVETGDLAIACYSCNHTITDLLTRGDPLDEVWQESKHGLDFAQKAKFRDVVDIIVSQQQFIANMRGRTAHFSTFSDAMFDEEAFEAQLTADRMATMVCWYWILKVQARFMSGDYEAALVAARKAKALLWSTDAHIQLLDYDYYTALAMAAVYETVPPDRQSELREDLTAHLHQLREWAESCSATFRDKHALVAAEIARLDGREVDAAHLYEEAIRLARENGFVQNEGIANELAARFYAARGFEKIARAYLRDARYGYLRWGAEGKVRQLDQLYPYLREDEPVPGLTRTIGAPVEHLDLATVIKISQAISGEIVLEKLLDTLMRTAMAQAGAERVLLILAQGSTQQIAAEATTRGDTMTVQLRDEVVAETVLPASVLHYVLRTAESVILDDAAAGSPFAADPYVRQRKMHSILCLPLLAQAKLIGALYLENSLAAGVFAPARVAVLKLLASQAAIALENARLYRDLAEREAEIRRLVDANIVGIFIFDLEGRIPEANDAFLRIVGYNRDDLIAGRLRWTDLTPPEWLERGRREWLPALKTKGSLAPIEKEYFRKDGSRVPVLIGAAAFEHKQNEGVAFVLDLSERKQAEAEARKAERRYREAQMELSDAKRKQAEAEARESERRYREAQMELVREGQLTASIAHEVKQPINAAAVNAAAGLRWLGARPPNVDEATQALERIVNDATRAGNIIGRIRDLIKKATPRTDSVDINEAVREVIELARGQAAKHGIAMQAVLGEHLPPVLGDRVQLQQVVINLIVNAVEAMSAMSEGPRALLISTAADFSQGVSIAVSDSGPGLPAEGVERVFEPFYTTKPSGLGMGLSICRSIVDAHGGRLSAKPNVPRGAVFQFTLPACADTPMGTGAEPEAPPTR
jgi:PAS domain S-box-containing protein